MKRLAIFFALISFSANSQTLQFFMPKEGMQFIEVGYSQNNITTVGANSRNRQNQKEGNISLRFEKSMSPFWAFGFDYVTTDNPIDTENYNGFGVNSTSSSSKRTGSRDLPIYLYGLLGAQLYWKAIYFHAIEEAKREDDINYSTGSHVGLTLGYLFTPTFGTRIDYVPGYSFEFDDNDFDNDKRTEGAQTTIAFFKEFISEASLYGIEFSYITQAQGSRVEKDGAGENSFNIDDTSAVRLKLYPAWNFGAFQLISNVSFTNFVSIEDMSQTELELGLDFRFNF